MGRRWLALAAALLPLLTSGCSIFFDIVGRPTLEDVRPRITGVDLEGVSLTLDVDVANPYFFRLVSPRFRYGIDVEGAEFVSRQESEGADIAARSIGTLALPIRLDYVKVWQAYRKLSELKEFSCKIHGALIFRVMGRSIDLPLSYERTLPVVRAPRFSNVTVQFSRLSLTHATVTLEADIENPNVFDVDVEGLGYQLMLGGTSVGNLTASTAGTVAAGERGRFKLTGQVSAASALFRLARGESLGAAKLSATGAITTPYGKVNLTK